MEFVVTIAKLHMDNHCIIDKVIIEKEEKYLSKIKKSSCILHIAHIFQQGIYTSSLYISVDRNITVQKKMKGERMNTKRMKIKSFNQWDAISYNWNTLSNNIA